MDEAAAFRQLVMSADTVPHNVDNLGDLASITGHWQPGLERNLKTVVAR